MRMRTQFLSRFAFLPIVVAVLASACAADATAPTSLPPAQSLDIYSGPLDPGGLSTYLFTLGETSSVELMLAGVVLDAPLRTIAPVLRIRFSRWNGTDCDTLLEADTVPRLTAALRGYFEAGTYCAIVTDPGNLTEPVGVTMRIVAPALLRASGAPGTDTFASTITPAGEAFRTVRASTAGTVTVALKSLSANVEMGLALGIPSSDFSRCNYSQIVRVLPGNAPQISARVDAGDYCAALFDVGNITRNESFALEIAHP